MNTRTKLVLAASGLVITGAAVAGCSTGTVASAPSAAAPQPAAATTAAASASSGPVLPVTSNPIVNTATTPDLQITYAAVEDNIDPTTSQPIDDRLELTLKNTGQTPLTGLEVYYEMTDVVTGQTEAYYQRLDGVTIPAGQETTVYFDNQTGPGHFPENEFSIYRSSTDEVDFAIQVSAPGAKIATATAVKATGTGEKVD